MGKALKKVKKKIVTDILPNEILPSPPAVVEPEPVEPPMVAEPTPKPKGDGPRIAIPGPIESNPVVTDGIANLKPDPKVVPVDPVVSDPVPVDPTPTETEETAQAVQRKKKGRKSLINTSSTGLGGSATVYTPTLLG